MLPLYEGRAEAIRQCLHHCRTAFDDPDIGHLENEESSESALLWKATIQRYIEQCDEANWNQSHFVELTDDQVEELASALNELADLVHYEYAKSR